MKSCRCYFNKGDWPISIHSGNGGVPLWAIVISVSILCSSNLVFAQDTSKTPPAQPASTLPVVNVVTDHGITYLDDPVLPYRRPFLLKGQIKSNNDSAGLVSVQISTDGPFCFSPAVFNSPIWWRNATTDNSKRQDIDWQIPIFPGLPKPDGSYSFTINYFRIVRVVPLIAGMYDWLNTAGPSVPLNKIVDWISSKLPLKSKSQFFSLKGDSVLSLNPSQLENMLQFLYSNNAEGIVRDKANKRKSYQRSWTNLKYTNLKDSAQALVAFVLDTSKISSLSTDDWAKIENPYYQSTWQNKHFDTIIDFIDGEVYYRQALKDEKSVVDSLKPYFPDSIIEAEEYASGFTSINDTALKALQLTLAFGLGSAHLGKSTNFALPFVGTKIYPWGVNSWNFPLQNPLDRFSFVFAAMLGAKPMFDGVQLTSLFGAVAPVVGINWDMTARFAFSAGAALFSQPSLNPLPQKSNASLAPAYYLGLILDFDVWSALKNAS